MPHGSTLVVKRHQIVHVIINKEMLHRCIDDGITSQLLDSDHCAIDHISEIAGDETFKNNNRGKKRCHEKCF